MAELFATHAAVAFGKARDIDNLTVALKSRTVIGQATGLVMAKYDLDQDAAFAFLQRTSSHLNMKLRQVAEQIVVEANARAGRDDLRSSARQWVSPILPRRSARMRLNRREICICVTPNSSAISRWVFWSQNRR